MRAIASVARRDERARLAHGTTLEAHAPTPERHALIARLRARATATPVALDESESKELLRAYGIATPAEALVTSRAAALEFSFFLSLPTMLVATSYALLKSVKGDPSSPLAGLI